MNPHDLPARGAQVRAATQPRPWRLATFLFLTLTLIVALALAVRSAHAQNLGIHKEYMDTSVDPCTDFFRYANGKWIDTALIPPSYVGVGAGREMFDRNQDALYHVLEDAQAKAATTQDPNLRKLGSLYASLMDSAHADREGWKPIAARLDEINRLKSAKDLTAEFARL